MLKQLAQQNAHYRLFHLAPKTLALINTSKQDMFPQFLLWAEQQSLSMHWTLPMHFLNWLHSQPEWQEKVGTDICKELLVATVTRWSLSGLEHVSAQGMMAVSKHLPEIAIGLWKSQQADKPAKITALRIPATSCPTEDSYALSSQQGNWQAAKWLALPL